MVRLFAGESMQLFCVPKKMNFFVRPQRHEVFRNRKDALPGQKDARKYRLISRIDRRAEHGIYRRFE